MELDRFKNSYQPFTRGKWLGKRVGTAQRQSSTLASMRYQLVSPIMQFRLQAPPTGSNAIGPSATTKYVIFDTLQAPQPGV